jgi:hypothetical protein
VFPANPQGIESITLNPVGSTGPQTLSVWIAGADQTITAGLASWVKGELKTPASTDVVAASGAWTSDHIYTLKVVRYRTPFNTTYTMRFAGDELLLDSEVNAGFGERKSPQLIGKAQ